MLIRFLKTIFLVDLLQGLWVTLKYTFRRKVTIQYPEQVKEPRERFRGILRLYRDDAGEPLCIACKMCQRACPESCFAIEGARDAGNQMRPTRFDWNLERCTFCGLCVEACPTSALRFSREFRLSAENRAVMHFTLATMYDDFDLARHFRPEEPRT